MTSSRKKLLAKFNCNAAAEVGSIGQVEAELGFDLPHDYKEFLLLANGGEGFIEDAYAIL